MTDPVGISPKMIQEAPFPDELADLVANLRYKPGWTFTLRNIIRDHIDPADMMSEPLAHGLTLDVVSQTFDSHHPEKGNNYKVHHYMIVPAATYNRASWQRWLFDQLLKIESHEAAEFFRIDGEQPYAPTHGPGDDPYIIREYATDEQRRTSFKGEVKSDVVDLS